MARQSIESGFMDTMRRACRGVLFSYHGLRTRAVLCWNNKGDYTGENQDKYFSDHVGYVVSVSGNTLYRVEGNAGGTNDTSKVQKRSYPINSVKINGYFRPDYPTPTPALSPAPSNGKTVTVKGKTSVIRDDTYCAANKLVTVKVGAKLTWLADDKWGWSKVQYNGKTGYTHIAPVAKRVHLANMAWSFRLRSRFYPSRKAACPMRHIRNWQRLSRRSLQA